MGVRSPARPRRAFTLAEVIVTVAIIAMLAAITVPTIRGRLQVGEANAIVAEVENLSTAITAYKQDVGRYPNNLVYLSQLPIPASASLDGCGNTLPPSAIAGYHGPYISRTLAAGAASYVLAGGDTVLTRYGTSPLTGATTAIELRVNGVDSTIAVLVDQSIDGANNNASGNITWVASGQSTLITFSIPIRPGSC